MTLTLRIHREKDGYVDPTPEVRSFTGEHLTELSCYQREDEIEREGRVFRVTGRRWTSDGNLTLTVHERVV